MAETLKSFMVSIGFDVDAASQKKSEDAVKRTETNTTSVAQAESTKRAKIEKTDADRRESRAKGEEKSNRERRERLFKEATAATTRFAVGFTQALAGIEFTALGVALAVDKAAQSFSKLNYASARAGSSPAGMTAFGFASQQLGSSAAVADSSLQTFGTNLRMYPAYRQRLAGLLGHKVDGVGSDELAAQLGERLAKMRDTGGPQGLVQAMNQASFFGFDDQQQVLTMMDPQLHGTMTARRAQMAQTGADPDATARSSVAFEQSMQRLQSVFEDIGTAIEGNLTQKLRPALDQMSEWAVKNAAQIEKFVTDLAGGLSQVTTAIAQSQPLWDALEKVSDGMKVLADFIGTDSFQKVIKNTSDEFDQLQRSLGNLIEWIEDKLKWFGFKPSTDDGIDPLRGSLGGAGGGTGAASRREMGGPDLAAAGSNRVGKAVQNANSRAIEEELRKAGMSNEGIAAALGSMQSESSFNPRAHNDVGGGHNGLWQWDATRWKKVSAWITAHDGDPADARWQTRAWLAEGRAKKGDAIFDSEETSAGFGKMEHATSVASAMAGVAMSERYGYGEEGGRGANARAHLKRMQTEAASIPPTVATINGRKPPLPPGAMYWAKDAEGNPQAVDAQGRAVGADGKPTTVGKPLGGDTTSNKTVNIVHNPTYNISGPDLAAALSASRLNSSRGQQDLLRNGQGAMQ